MSLKLAFFCCAFMFVITANGQSTIEWSPNYELSLADFQNTASEIGAGRIISLQSGSQVEFSFYMTNAEFMMTKNWNSKVKATFNKTAAYIIAPDDTTVGKLVSLSQFHFDLAELYARKFRKELYKNKKAFSNVSFIQPIYDRMIKEYSERGALVNKETDLGNRSELLKQRHDEVLAEIDQLNEFCKECKAVKKKRL
jgi:hypothetical protein